MIYLQYLFTGLRTDDMTPFMTSLIGTIRTLFLLLIGFAAQGLANQFSKGDYSLNFSVIQGYVMPGVVIILELVWKFAREASNPAITVSQLGDMRTPNVPRV